MSPSAQAEICRPDFALTSKEQIMRTDMIKSSVYGAFGLPWHWQS